jgi:hypothetical protein
LGEAGSLTCPVLAKAKKENGTWKLTANVLVTITPGEHQLIRSLDPFAEMEKS